MRVGEGQHAQLRDVLPQAKAGQAAAAAAARLYAGLCADVLPSVAAICGHLALLIQEAHAPCKGPDCRSPSPVGSRGIGRSGRPVYMDLTRHGVILDHQGLHGGPALRCCCCLGHRCLLRRIEPERSAHEGWNATGERGRFARARAVAAAARRAATTAATARLVHL